MAIRDILVPQMGEGLQEVLISALLKRPGDSVERDEILYTMETDKADMDVESPHAGILREWLVEEGDVVSIGSPVARIETATADLEQDAPDPAALPKGTSAALPSRPGAAAPRRESRSRGGRAAGTVRGRSDVLVAPRARARCRELGLSEEEIAQIPADGILLPADVERYLAVREARGEGALPAPAEAAFEDLPLPRQQQVFNFRLKRSAEQVIPATMVRRLEWSRFEAAVEALRRRHVGVQVSDFDVFAYCVAQTSIDHPRFRSRLVAPATVRTHRHLNLGVAVQRGAEELVTAVVPRADRLDFPSFVTTAGEAVRRALEGEDQATDEVQLHLSFVSAYQITEAVPVVVAPAAAVLFLGAPFGPPSWREANLGTTFDHRLINGVGAAEFLNDLAGRLEQLGNEEPVAETVAGAPAALRDLLEAAAPDERRDRLEILVGEQIAALIERDPAEVRPEEPLRNLGLDSRLAVELTRRLASGLNLTLPPTLLWAYPTSAELASHLAQKLGGVVGADSEPAPRPELDGASVASLLDEIDRLSDDEAQDLLDDRLRT